MNPGDRIFVVAEEEAARCRWDYANLTWISTHLPDMTVARCVSCSATFKSDDVEVISVLCTSPTSRAPGVTSAHAIWASAYAISGMARMLSPSGTSSRGAGVASVRTVSSFPAASSCTKPSSRYQMRYQSRKWSCEYTEGQRRGRFGYLHTLAIHSTLQLPAIFCCPCSFSYPCTFR
ncbi:hypothetical protein BD626DRAFT_184858 [Schizophyllum amplum]|uniref:Uncharacterized protein n=1 Tax=Schizophyllum amplum TaxID=97359 RepID=A0A550C0W1_9AGAR|nr:hypothetical protein BD626DRAFT_184858 [Auriculariopsis ampla]